MRAVGRNSNMSTDSNLNTNTNNYLSVQLHS